MGSVYKATRVDAKGKRVKYKFWRVSWTDKNGKPRSKKAFTDKQASEALLRKIEVDVERKKAGLTVVEEDDRRRKWDEVSALYLGELVSQGSEPEGQHVRQVRSVLRRVGESCHWSSLADIRKDAFSRHLAGMAAMGKSPQTRKSHHTIVSSCLNWCLSMGWLPEHPLKGLKSPVVGPAGKTRLRRAYTRDEFTRLLLVAPEPRRTLYLIAALSGFRRKELWLMEGQDFDASNAKPQWRARAAITKNGRRDVVPIVPDLIPIMRRLGERLAPSKRLVADALGMRCVPHMKTLYGDLKRAGVRRVDDYGRHADFHSFRYTFCRLMGELLPIQKVKVLMRHATIGLTADLYGKLGIDDLGEEVWSLPCLNMGAEWDSRESA